MAVTLNSLSDSTLVSLLLSGAIGVLPTDTVYGLVCRAGDKIAVSKLYKQKSREKKPGTVIASSVEQLAELGIKDRYLKAVERFWPNPISVVIPCSSELDYLDQGLRTLAVRVSNNTALNKLIEKVGPLLTSSANLPGETTAGNVKSAKKYFGDKIDFYVDSGDLSGQKSSTLIRIVGDTVEVLRQGAVEIPYGIISEDKK